MRQTERGLLLLCCPLGDPMAGALSLAQARELSRRARAAGIGEEDPFRDVTVKDVRRLGYSEYEAGHIVSLLGRERQLDGYLLAAEKAGVTVITRLDNRFPRKLREQLGARCPAALFCRGDLRLLQRPCISVVGSRHLAQPGAQFAAQAGCLAAKEGFTLCSGDAMGADRTAQEACLRGGGSVLIFPATELVYCPVRENVLYAAEGGFEFGGSFAITNPEPGYYMVEAPWFPKVLKGIDVEDYEALQYMQRVLEKSGVFEALRQRGIQEGDIVSLYDIEFEYIP